MFAYTIAFSYHDTQTQYVIFVVYFNGHSHIHFFFREKETSDISHVIASKLRFKL